MFCFFFLLISTVCIHTPRVCTQYFQNYACAYDANVLSKRSGPESTGEPKVKLASSSRSTHFCSGLLSIRRQFIYSFTVSDSPPTRRVRDRSTGWDEWNPPTSADETNCFKFSTFVEESFGYVSFGRVVVVRRHRVCSVCFQFRLKTFLISF